MSFDFCQYVDILKLVCIFPLPVSSLYAFPFFYCILKNKNTKHREFPKEFSLFLSLLLPTVPPLPPPHFFLNKVSYHLASLRLAVKPGLALSPSTP